MEKQTKLSTIYCIDASALINLRRYRRDVFPTVWEKMERKVQNGLLISHAEVLREIDAGKDEILKWCRKNRRMFKGVDDCQRKQFEIIESRYEENYWNMSVNKPGPWADPWIIALAICENGVIVTDESNKRNRIPAIAEKLHVSSLSLLDFFKEIGVKY